MFKKLDFATIASLGMLAILVSAMLFGEAPKPDPKEEARKKKIEQQRQDREAKVKAEQAFKDACNDGYTLYSLVQKEVLKRLKSPKSAEFASYRDPTIAMASEINSKTGDCEFVVRSYVDSQNGFGALVRTPFGAILTLKKDLSTYKVDRVVFAKRY